MTFQALRNRVGEADFWAILQAWVTDHRNGHGTRAAFHALAEDVSGEDLDGFFGVWLDVGQARRHRRQRPRLTACGFETAWRPSSTTAWSATGG